MSTIEPEHAERVPMTRDEAEGLTQSLLELAWTLKGPQFATLVARMVNTARRLCRNGRFPTDPQELAYLRTALSFLGQVERHPRMTPNGVLYRGRPDFVTDELLAALLEEARNEVRPRAIWQRGHILGVGGPLADQVAIGEPLHSLVQRVAGPVDRTGVASYLFYEAEGEGIPPHVDSGVFSVNVNLILHREDTGVRASHLYLFHTDGKTREELVLDPGDMVITFGDSVLHGRSLLAAGEVITNVTFGFQPSSWTDE